VYFYILSQQAISFVASYELKLRVGAPDEEPHRDKVGTLKDMVGALEVCASN